MNIQLTTMDDGDFKNEYDTDDQEEDSNEDYNNPSSLKTEVCL